jgi:hypothetical protein
LPGAPPVPAPGAAGSFVQVARTEITVKHVKRGKAFWKLARRVRKLPVTRFFITVYIG